MKKAIIIISVILVGLLTIGCAAGTSKSKTANHPKKETQKAASKSKKKDNIYPGVVFEVNPESKTIKVRQENTDLAMVFDISNAKLDGYKDVKDVKNGDKVAIEYKVERGSTIALTVSKR